MTSNWDPYLAAASSDWNASSVLQTTILAGSTTGRRCRPTAGRVEVYNASYGQNGWLGLASIWASGSHITQGTAKMNDSYFNLAQNNTPAWKQLVVCQEVAHTFGLGHQDETFNNPNLGSCMDYTNKRYEPIDYTLSLGTITKVSMENLIDQMEALERQARDKKTPLTPVEPGRIAAVAVSPGPGVARVFASLGVSAIVEGGQTMNPSTQDILEAFENLPTDHIIILPNNKNIIMAAKSAAELTVKKVAVVPSQTVPEGLAAMLRLIPDGDFDRVVADMSAAIDEVQTGEITTAVRNANIDGVLVEEGEIIALLNRKLIHSATNLEEACLGLLEKAEVENCELVTLF